MSQEYNISIYIAGTSLDIPRAERFAAAARALGFKVTKEWWKDIELANAHGWEGDDSVNDEFAKRCAQEDLVGVDDADVLVFLDSAAKSFGAAVEVGAALSQGLRVICVGEPRGRIWERLDLWTNVLTEADALQLLTEIRNAP